MIKLEKNKKVQDFLDSVCQQIWNKNLHAQIRYELLNHLEDFVALKYPVLVGISHKSMIQKVLDCSAKEALNGTSILNTIALLKGAKILRVHEVKEAIEVVKIVKKFQ